MGHWAWRSNKWQTLGRRVGPGFESRRRSATFIMSVHSAHPIICWTDFKDPDQKHPKFMQRWVKILLSDLILFDVQHYHIFKTFSTNNYIFPLFFSLVLFLSWRFHCLLNQSPPPWISGARMVPGEWTIDKPIPLTNLSQIFVFLKHLKFNLDPISLHSIFFFFAFFFLFLTFAYTPSNFSPLCSCPPKKKKSDYTYILSI